MLADALCTNFVRIGSNETNDDSDIEVNNCISSVRQTTNVININRKEFGWLPESQQDNDIHLCNFEIGEDEEEWYEQLHRTNVTDRKWIVPTRLQSTQFPTVFSSLFLLSIFRSLIFSLSSCLVYPFHNSLAAQTSQIFIRPCATEGHQKSHKHTSLLFQHFLLLFCPFLLFTHRVCVNLVCYLFAAPSPQSDEWVKWNCTGLAPFAPLFSISLFAIIFHFIYLTHLFQYLYSLWFLRCFFFLRTKESIFIGLHSNEDVQRRKFTTKRFDTVVSNQKINK